jgi:hypothetical protein
MAASVQARKATQVQFRKRSGQRPVGRASQFHARKPAPLTKVNAQGRSFCQRGRGSAASVNSSTSHRVSPIAMGCSIPWMTPGSGGKGEKSMHQSIDAAKKRRVSRHQGARKSKNVPAKARPRAAGTLSHQSGQGRRSTATSKRSPPRSSSKRLDLEARHPGEAARFVIARERLRRWAPSTRSRRSPTRTRDSDSATTKTTG